MSTQSKHTTLSASSSADKSTSSSKKIIKCIVWDLDNTIWHGILSENDQLIIRVGVADIIRTLDSWGIVQSIASKNNHDEAMKTLSGFGLAEFFLYPQINWGPKSDSITRIREKLNIGIDAIAFVDDQPFERDEVAFAHPQVTCLGEDRIAEILTLFKPRFITGESAQRRKMYLDDDLRDQEEKATADNRLFLQSLQLQFSIRKASLEDLRRVEELTLRTNQLNTTGYTYSYDELEELIHSPLHLLLVSELTDKYGSYGKIGVALLHCRPDTWTLKLLLMSCRVMSRGVGGVLLNYIMNSCREKGCRLQAEFLPTDRNRLMYVTYKFAGFTEKGILDNGGALLEHPLSSEIAYPDYIAVSVP